MIRDQIRAVIEPLQHGSNLDAATDAVMEVIKDLLPAEKECNRCDDGMTINENFRTKEPCRHCQ